MKLYNLKHRKSVLLYYENDNHFNPIGFYESDNKLIIKMYNEIKKCGGYNSDSSSEEED